MLQLITMYEKSARPAQLCPCGSGVLYISCHGRPHGVALHPSALCPCGGKKAKSFGKCCKGKVLWRETLDTKFQQKMIPVDSVPAPCRELMNTTLEDARNQHLAAGGTLESFAEKPFGGLQIPTGKEMDFMKYSLVLPLVLSGNCCQAYASACMQCDFQYAKPWYFNNVPQLDKTEMLKRQQEWNGFVDRYIACLQSPTAICPHCKESEGTKVRSGAYKGRVCRKKVGECQFGEDYRSAADIERSAKISVSGGPLYVRCGNPDCDKEEETPSQFQLCSRCKQTRFCSPECFKAAWKPHHKKVCGTDAAHHRHPSQVAVEQAMIDMAAKVSKGEHWDPLRDLAKQHGLGP